MAEDIATRAARLSQRFGARLRELRLRAELSQAQLAERIGVPQSRVGEWEVCRGRTGGPAYPTWEQVVRIALALDVSTELFLREPSAEQPPPRPHPGRPKSSTS